MTPSNHNNTTDRDWREYAYLRKENWPDAIPPTGPKRRYGPYPFARPDHDDPHDLDTYPNSHPDAASVGESHLGDVCPYCGVPLDWLADTVVTIDGERGVFADVNAANDPVPAYHPACWTERQATAARQEYRTLDTFAADGENDE